MINNLNIFTEGSIMADYRPITLADIQKFNKSLKKQGGKLVPADADTLRVEVLPAHLTEAQDRKFRHGDEVEIVKDGKYNGATGEVDDYSSDQKFVIVNVYNHGGKLPFLGKDLTLINPGAETDNEISKFYVAFYDRDEERSWIGLITRENGGKWHEKKAVGRPGYRWGQTYESSLTPDKIMARLNSGFDRSIEIEGPLDTLEAAEEYVHDHWGTITESVNESYRLVDTVGSNSKSKTAKIYFDHEDRSYKVSYFNKGKTAREDSFVDDRYDAEELANDWVNSTGSFKSSVNEVNASFNDLEAWKVAVKKAYPNVASKLKFKGIKDRFGSHISAEVPGEDRSYGVFDLTTGQGEVLGESNLDEALPERIQLIQKQIDAALKDSNPTIRMHAFSSKYVNPDHISKGLNDRDWKVRQAAISHANATYSHVKKALGDENERVRQAASVHHHIINNHPEKTTKERNMTRHKSMSENQSFSFLRALMEMNTTIKPVKNLWSTGKVREDVEHLDEDDEANKLRTIYQRFMQSFASAFPESDPLDTLKSWLTKNKFTMGDLDAAIKKFSDSPSYGRFMKKAWDSAADDAIHDAKEDIRTGNVYSIRQSVFFDLDGWGKNIKVVRSENPWEDAKSESYIFCKVDKSEETNEAVRGINAKWIVRNLDGEPKRFNDQHSKEADEWRKTRAKTRSSEKRAPKEEIPLHQIYNKFMDAYSNSFPDGDPVDAVMPWLNRNGYTIKHLNAAIKKFDGAATYLSFLKAGWDSMAADAIYDAKQVIKDGGHLDNSAFYDVVGTGDNVTIKPVKNPWKASK